MTKAGAKYFLQEVEMVNYRVALHYGLPTNSSGNPMTVEEAVKHLTQTEQFIENHPELYE